MESYLERCLSSLVISDKLMEMFEVLVINDGSKDRSSEIAHSFEDNHPQTFRVIDKKNGNYGSCVNRGLEEARGKYIKVLDADDWFDTNNFEKLLKVMSQTDADCIMSDMIQVDEEGNTISLWNYSLPRESMFSMKEILKLNELLWMHCVAYKTENLKNIHYQQTEGISYTDQEWLFLPMSTCKSFFYYPQVIYKYFVGRNGQTMDPEVFKKNFWQEIRGTINMATQFGHYRDNRGDAYTYLAKRLLGRSMTCYGTFLESYRMERFYKEMKELDRVLKHECPNLYHELDDLNRLISKKNNYFQFFPRSWVLLVYLWRKSNLQEKSMAVLTVVRIIKFLKA